MPDYFIEEYPKNTEVRGLKRQIDLSIMLAGNEQQAGKQKKHLTYYSIASFFIICFISILSYSFLNSNTNKHDKPVNEKKILMNAGNTTTQTITFKDIKTNRNKVAPYSSGNCKIDSDKQEKINKGKGFMATRKYTEAIDHLKTIKQQNKNDCASAITSWLIGDSYKKLNDIENARKHLKHSEDYYLKTNTISRELGLTYKSLGQTEHRGRNYQSSCDYYNKALNIFKVLDNAGEIQKVKNSIVKSPICSKTINNIQ